MINVKTNIDKFINSEIKRYDRVTKRALRSAKNKVAQQGRSEASRVIRTHYGVQVKGLSFKLKSGHNALGYTRAKTFYDSSAVVARGQGIPLKYFGGGRAARQVQEGVYVEIKKGSPKIVKHAFGPNIPRLGKHVFMRKWERGRFVKRTPIVMKWGPGAAPMLDNPDVKRRTKEFIRMKFPSIYADAFRYFNSK